MRNVIFLLITFYSILSFGQNSSINGLLVDDQNEAIVFANVALYSSMDSSLVKVETTDIEGVFTMESLEAKKYYLMASYIGHDDLIVNDIDLTSVGNKNLGSLILSTSSIKLETAVVTAKRALVEVKPDRTVFNVQGTINSTGDNGLELLRKAPGVLVDNNNNITVLSRSGVLVYVDGKRLPLGGDDLSNYLQNLTSSQIDRIDIITNPGAKYEAEGNAGIIDIRLKKNENHGMNGSVTANIGRGTGWRNGISSNLNFRNKALNTYLQIGAFDNDIRQLYFFDDFINDIFIRNIAVDRTLDTGGNLRWGTDFYLNENSTIGFLTSVNKSDKTLLSSSDNKIASASDPSNIDSLLVASNNGFRDFNSQSFNLNYAYNKNESTLNVDVDYGRYRTDADSDQPNTYLTPDSTTVLTRANTAYTTPVDIDIYTAKLDYETNLAGGRFGVGTKLSIVQTDNTFVVFDVPLNDRILNTSRSNRFKYDENVYAGYVSYARPISQKLSFTSGLRLEQTEATGDLIPFDPDLEEPPVELSYLSIFPNAGFTYSINPQNVVSLNYGRRINRPDYNVLNPFEAQINELSFSKGNPFLSPEIVNNIEVGYLWKFRYNIKLAYSRTTDQITRLIGPDDRDPRARFINWDNLAEQKTYSLNLSLPFEITKRWNAFFNLSGSYLNNQADYGDGAVVDLQAFSYNIFQQHTITLPKGFVGEVSGWFSGPGIWGGVFEYTTSWSLNLGLQKRFFDNKLNVKLSAQDIFNQAGWEGSSEFNGLVSIGRGEWDSRRVSLSMSYSFGNDKVKSRNRSTGIEDEAERVN